MIEKHGTAFTFYPLNRIDIELAMHVHKATQKPTKLLKKTDLDYSHLTRSIQDGSSMNMIGITISMNKGYKEVKNSTHEDGKKCSCKDDNDHNQGEGGPPSNKKKKVVNSNSGTQSDTEFASLCAARSRQTPTLQILNTNGKEMCVRWFIKGICDNKCIRKATHIKAEGVNLEKIKSVKIKLKTETRDNSGA